MSEQTNQETELVEQPAAELPPPKIFKRLENGLVEGVEYIRRADGRIDWTKMIRPEYVVFNSKLDDKLIKAYGKPAAELNYGELLAAGVEVDPRHVMVLLQGFYELADLRGYYEATPQLVHADLQICACQTTISWLPNEEEPEGKTSYGTADATMENTNGWGYLAAMAGNRAFVRAVKQGLRIPILGFDEIAKKDSALPEAPASQGSGSTGGAIHTATLKQAAERHVDEKGGPLPIPFESVKASASDKHRAKMESDPSTWSRWEDIPPKDCLTLIKLIKAKEKR